MVDIHSHVLPEMDDGSASVEESLAMLEASAQQGIDRIAATPHFYPSENDPMRFLERRARSVQKLTEAWRPGLPQLLLGAEVYYFEGMSRVAELGALRIEGTPILLLEMPFDTWTERMIDELLALQRQRRFWVLLAHIERYFRFQSREIWDLLLNEGVLMQCNADFFLSWRTGHKARKMLREGRIHLLGSDCHNMRQRPPHLGKALKTLGSTERKILEENIAELLPEPVKEAIS